MATQSKTGQFESEPGSPRVNAEEPVKYHVRLVLEARRGTWHVAQTIRECILHDPTPDLTGAMQAYDDVLKAIDESHRADEPEGGHD